jgi:2-dehydropantoate 2-reductase
MKLCVFGAGAVGGHLGATLAMAGNHVSLIARGPHLEAMQARGLRLIDQEGTEHVLNVAASDRPEDFGPQDYVVLSTKAYAAPEAVVAMKPLLGPDTCVVTASNGLPWWYFHKLPGPWEDRRIHMVDPGDAQWNRIGPDRVLGTVLWVSAEILEPGVVRHTFGNRMPLGEPDGTRSDRATALADILNHAGMKSPVRSDIRSEIWLKLWGNAAFNPVSVLTQGTLHDLATDPGVRPVIKKLMTEVQAVAEALGITFPVDVDTRIQMAADVGAHPTSTLQDLLAGKPLELDALVGAVVEMAKMVDVPAPTLETVFGLAVRRARQAGCYPGKA